MKTTVLVIEYLVAGVLVSLAFMFCVASFFPEEIQTIINNLDRYQSVPANVLLTTIFIAIAYAVGIFSEFLGFNLFEWKLKRIKKKRMKKYISELINEDVDLGKSCILKRLKGIPPDKITEEQAVSCIGPMRFYVLKESPTLYQEIASQIDRMRLIRVLFLVEIILMVGLLRQLIREFSPPLAYAFIFLALVAVLNVKAIISRFDRYCRAIERSYTVLVFC